MAFVLFMINIPYEEGDEDEFVKEDEKPIENGEGTESEPVTIKLESVDEEPKEEMEVESSDDIKTVVDSADALVAGKVHLLCCKM